MKKWLAAVSLLMTTWQNMGRSDIIVVPIPVIVPQEPTIPARPLFSAAQLLEVIAATPNGSQIRLPAGVTETYVEAAFDDLDKKLSADPLHEGKRLRVDPAFERRLSSSQKSALLRLQIAYSQKIATGDLHIANTGSGFKAILDALRGEGYSPDVSSAENEIFYHGVDPEHFIGNGKWSWSLRPKWYGVQLRLDHNYLWNLCRDTSWMLESSTFAEWIHAVVQVMTCLPHSLDYNTNGVTVYITWAGAFWITP